MRDSGKEGRGDFALPDLTHPALTTHAVTASSQTAGTKPNTCSVVSDDAAASDVNKGENDHVSYHINKE